jgi:hypothetical protein
MTDRGPVTRCTVKACPMLGHFAAYDGYCPMHRDDLYYPTLPLPPLDPTREDIE